MNLTISAYESAAVLRATSALLLDLARIREDEEATAAFNLKGKAAPAEKIQDPVEVTKTKKSKPAPTPAAEAPVATPEPAAESPSEEPPFEGGTEVEGPTLEEVRAVLVQLSESGKSERCKALIQGQGVKSLSELKDQPKKLADLLRAAKEQLV
jgi:hypothetical protein